VLERPVSGPRIEEPVSKELHQPADLLIRELRLGAEERIHGIQDRLDRSQRSAQIGVEAGRRVLPARPVRVEMVAHHRFEGRERTVVAVRGLHGEIAERRRAELVPVSDLPRDLLETEVLVGLRPVERRVGDVGTDLRQADRVLLEIAEHLVRLPRHRVAAHASCLSKEEDRAPLLPLRHGGELAPRKAVDGRVRARERELEFGQSPSEMIER
jgi:hypothetical protein